MSKRSKVVYVTIKRKDLEVLAGPAAVPEKSKASNISAGDPAHAEAAAAESDAKAST